MKKVLYLATLFCSIITISALMAHLLEMPNKMKLDQEEYKTVQSIYSGWAFLGVFEIGAIVGTVVWTVSTRKQTGDRYLPAVAVNCFIGSFVLFFLFTYPANQETHNWTQIPLNWQQLRKNWEYSHALRAVINLFGLFFLLFFLIRRRYYRR